MFSAFRKYDPLHVDSPSDGFCQLQAIYSMLIVNLNLHVEEKNLRIIFYIDMRREEKRKESRREDISRENAVLNTCPLFSYYIL